jgi:hypothetical protein
LGRDGRRPFDRGVLRCGCEGVSLHLVVLQFQLELELELDDRVWVVGHEHDLVLDIERRRLVRL